MKSFALSAAAVAICASQAAAFPAMMSDPNSPMFKAWEKRQINAAAPQGTGALPLVPPPFDAASQYVSNTGAHAFVAPTATDMRGECPGLNAMANHGYLPHNGIATIAQFVAGTYQVFGMAADLATFLSVYGAVVDGTLTGWSINGTPHIGIGGSHGNYETDSSPIKSDLNQYGSNGKLVMEQFYELYNLQPNADTANYNLEILRNFRATRFQESIAKNPLFTYNAFAGIAVSQAAFTFIYRFMANKSAEYPEGVLNKAVLKSFMSIQGPENNLKWVPGNERIPDNWYKRNDADQYSIAYFQTDILYIAETVPQILDIGCNMGTVNSYNSISVSTLSGGAYTAASVAANPLCFAGAVAQAAATSLLGLSSTALSSLTSALSSVNTALGGSCPVIKNPNFSTSLLCPGFSLYGGPTGPVAPGAIQS